jgi:hypothetical protein
MEGVMPMGEQTVAELVAAMGFASVDDLAKALSTGSGVVAADATGGQALRPQALDAQLVSTTLMQDDALFFQQAAKVNSPTPVYEYTRRTSLGGARVAPFISETGSPLAVDAGYERKLVNLKYAGVQKTLTRPFIMTANIVDAAAEANMVGTTHLLQRIDGAIFDADSTMNTLGFDGIVKQVTDYATGDFTDIVIDAGGGRLTPDLLMAADSIIRSHGGAMDQVWLSPEVFSDFAVQLKTYYHIPQGIGMENVQLKDGKLHPYIWRVDGMRSTIGFYTDPLALALKPNRAVRTVGDTGAPDLAASVTSTAGATGGLLATGNWMYSVSAVGQSGEGAGVADGGGAQAVTLGEVVTLTITAGTAHPYYWNIYRAPLNALTPLQYIGRVVDSGGATTTYVDAGAVHEGGCDVMCMTSSFAGQAISPWVQMGSLFKVPLAPLAMSEQFALLMFGAPVVKVPGWCVKITNVDVA